MKLQTLNDWLTWQEGLHPSAIDLGLDRLRVVLMRLALPTRSVPVITVAGTKGKGSCSALLDSIYRAAGYRTGLFTSPHLLKYNERIRIDGRMVSDAALCSAFERIETARGEVSLTYFEFNALAAFVLFADADLDVWILEVGMGGRLDAVNVVDADVAIVTSIGLDHTEWLGNDLDSIGREKAGIARAHRPLVFGAELMPDSVAQVADEVGAALFRVGHDFGFTGGEDRWSWWWRDSAAATLTRWDDLPRPGIQGAVQLFNAATALGAVHCLQARLPVNLHAIQQGLANVMLAGRFQRHIDPQDVEWVLDVAHNAMSAEVLADHLSILSRRYTVAIIGVMADKDLPGMVMALRNHVDDWIATALPGTRALPVTQLAAQLNTHGCRVIHEAPHVNEACVQAQQLATAHPPARVLVCGSFLTVGPALQFLELTGG